MEFLKKHGKAIGFLVLLTVFWGQYLIFGIVRSVDTIHFEEFSPLVYPLYSATLWIFRTLFGADRGYFLVGLFQNLLLVIAIVSLNDYIKKAFRLDGVTHCLLLLISVAIFLVQKWLTRAGLISSNTLISEGISIPFYLLFFRYVLQAVLEFNKKAFFVSCLFATGIILTRAQLYWVLAVVFVVRLYLSDSSRKKAFFSAILVCAVIAGFVQGTRVIQNASVEDEQSKAPSSMYMLSTAVYCSEPEDAALFPADSAEQLLFVRTREWIDDPAQHAAFSYETGDLTNRHKNFETYYDHVKGMLTYHYLVLLEDGLVPNMMNMFVKLILANPGAYLLHCAQNGLVGLIRTVAILRPGVNILAGLFYLYLLGCLLISRKKETLKNERLLTCLGLLCALLNALVMAPGVFALSRYMFYNLPILYFTAILFLRGLVIEWCKK